MQNSPPSPFHDPILGHRCPIPHHNQHAERDGGYCALRHPTQRTTQALCGHREAQKNSFVCHAAHGMRGPEGMDCIVYIGGHSIGMQTPSLLCTLARGPGQLRGGGPLEPVSQNPAL